MSDQRKPHWLTWASTLQAIAQTGLTYCENPFDKERYVAIQELAAAMMAEYSQEEPQKLQQLFAQDTGYATPKLDVRAVVIRDNKILMVQEHSDGLWSLPGGFADVNESPGEAAVREVWEESGFQTRAVKLLALYDKLKHTHPPQLPHIYKCFFLCDIIGGSAQTSIETTAVSFFAENELPPLSPHRITAQQIKRCFAHFYHPEWPTDFD